jgi:hypothetical protein
VSVRTAAILLISSMHLVALQQVKTPEPPLPYVDPGASPGEHRGYGEWTALKSTSVYDTWQAPRRTIGQVSKGGKVVARTGLVITLRPGRIRIDRDLPEYGLKRGDIILTYTSSVRDILQSGSMAPTIRISISLLQNGQMDPAARGTIVRQPIWISA